MKSVYLVIAAAVIIPIIIILAVVLAVSGSKGGKNSPAGGREEDMRSYFDGRTIQLIGWRILAALLTAVTLGIAFPWATCMLEKWQAKHTVINGRRLKFTGHGIQLLGRYILWVFLTVITLGIYSIWFGLGLEKWRVKHTVYADDDSGIESRFTGSAGGWFVNHILFFLITVFTLGIGYAWGEKRLVKWKTEHTEIGGSPLVFSGTGGQLFVRYLLLGLLTPLTLGIYALLFPVRYLRWQVSHTDALYRTEPIKALSRAHEADANKDYAKFRLAANDAELAIVKSGINGNESSEKLEELASENPYAQYMLAVKLKGNGARYEDRALELLQAASDAKYHKAMYDLAVQNGENAQYAPLLDGAARGGNSDAPWLLWQYFKKNAYSLYKNKDGRCLETLKTAAYWFKIAIEQEHPRAVPNTAEYNKTVETIAIWQCIYGRPNTTDGGSVVGIIVAIVLAIVLVVGGLGIASFIFGFSVMRVPKAEAVADRNEPISIAGGKSDSSDENEYVGKDIPNVLYDSQKEATRRLENLGFTVEPIYKETDEYESGTVIDISPAVGDTLYPGDTVTIYVAKAIEYPELDEATAWELIERAHDAAILPYYFNHDGIVDRSDVYEVMINPESNFSVAYPSAHGIDTVDDLINSLSRHFTNEYINDRFINAEYKKWIEANGTLYFEPNWGMGFYGMWRDTMIIEKISDGVYRVSAYGGIPDEYRNDPNYSPTYYEIVYENDGYKVNDTDY